MKTLLWQDLKKLDVTHVVHPWKLGFQCQIAITKLSYVKFLLQLVNYQGGTYKQTRSTVCKQKRYAYKYAIFRKFRHKK